MFRKVPYIRHLAFPIYIPVDIETFEAFSTWLRENKLPALYGVYHERDGEFKYTGYIPATMYSIAVCFVLNNLADNVMDCVRKAHISLGVGFTKAEIGKIYNDQPAHLGMALFASMWMHLEETRPGSYMKLTTKAERDDLMKNILIARDVSVHRSPWYTGNNSRCFYHIHAFQIGAPCVRHHSTDIFLWVLDKHGVLHELQEWRAKSLRNPVQTERAGGSFR